VKHREPTLTHICGSCKNPYGRWRPRCPACGATTPISVREEALRAPETTKPRKEKAPRPDQCILCRRKKAKDKCTHCGERIHHICKRLHEPACAAFQVELQEAIAAPQLERAVRSALGGGR